MRFEWDDAKAAAPLEKHGLSFVAAARVFNDRGRWREESTRPEYGERRWKAVGVVDDTVIAVVFTIRDGTCRIISARRARANERAEYHRRHPAS